MKLTLLSFCVGVFIIEQFPSNYSLQTYLSALILFIPLIFGLLRFLKIYSPHQASLFLLLGALWALFHIESQRNAVIPVNDFAGESLELEVEIISLPKQVGEAQQVTVIVTDVIKPEIKSGIKASQLSVNLLIGRKLNLRWFLSPIAQDQLLGRWQFSVKLKPPRGLVNPVGFDYEKWLFAENIVAVGTIKEGKPISRAGLSFSARVQIWRQQIKSELLVFIHSTNETAILSKNSEALLLALLLGDRSGLSQPMWDVLSSTQTSHLIAISGLHISLVVGLIVFIGNFLLRWFHPMQVARYKVLIYCLGLIAAGFYTLLAGFTLPTQRAFFMSSVVVIGFFMLKNTTLFDAVLWAVFFVLLIQPLAPMSVSFWLSVVAVTWIALLVSGRLEVNKSLRAKIWLVLRLQSLLYLAMLPLSLLFFGKISVVGLVANWFAIPLVTFLLLPLVVLVCAVFGIYSDAAVVLFYGLDFFLNGFWGMLSWFAEQEYLLRLNVGLLQNLMADQVVWLLIAVALICLPIPFRFKVGFIPVLLLPFLLLHQSDAYLSFKGERLTEGYVRLIFFDVGQGTSVFVQTRDHALLYDTGAEFPSGFNMADAVVLPYLQQRFRRHLDLLVISHSDLDHSGGVEVLQEHFVLSDMETLTIADDWRLWPPPAEGSHHQGIDCLDGIQWRWNQVAFQLIKAEMTAPLSSNDASCLIEITLGEQRILLAGDIEKAAEAQLLRTKKLNPQTLVLVPHHGSKTSSTLGFVNAVAADYAVVSAGYDNRFGHPDARVVDRYLARNAQVLSTAEGGALEFEISASGVKQVTQYRLDKQEFWRHSVTESETAFAKFQTTSNIERKIANFELNLLKKILQGFIMSGL